MAVEIFPPPNLSLEDYLKQDRQWPRRLRLDHARHCLATYGDTEFWKKVIERNTQ